MRPGLSGRMRRLGLIAAALLLCTLAAAGSLAPAFFSPLLAVMLLGAFEFSPVWLAPAALALGLAAELLLGRSHLGALPVALATAGWIVLRGRDKLAPGNLLGYAAYGVVAGLAARAACFLFVRIAGYENPAGLGVLLMQGAVYDFIAVALLRLAWPKAAESR